MKYKDTLADAKNYNRKKDTGKMTVDCSGCGKPIPMNGETCIEFGVYACQICRKGKMMIKDDKPKDAEPATPEERAAILEKLAAHISPSRVIKMYDEKRQGTFKPTPDNKPQP